MRRLILSLTMLLVIKEVRIESNILSNYKIEDTMNLSNNFTKMVEQHEGFSQVPYTDARGLLTIGFGTLIDSAQLEYLRTATIDKKKGEELLFYNASKERFVLNSLIAQGLTVNQNQFDALADFAYNEGYNALLGSHLLKVIMKNPSDFDNIKKQFVLWDKTAAVNPDGTVKRHPDGSIVLRVLPGLATRRLDEFTLYSTPVI